MNKEKITYRIWTNGGNIGMDCKTFQEALKHVWVSEDTIDWKNREILITEDHDNEDGSVSKSKILMKLCKTRYAKEASE